jgi:hypothetical protein
MKKIGIVLAIIVVGLTLFGCPTTHPPAPEPTPAAAAAPKTYSVDLSALSYQIFSDKTGILPAGAGKGAKNATAIPARWDGVLFAFGALPDSITSFKRVTINAKYYDASGKEIAQGDGKVMVVVAYDLKGDLKGPEMGAGRNTPLKEFNVGGASGLVSGEKGVRINLAQAPGGVLLQAADAAVKFIEVTQITFHNGTAND